MAHYYQKYILLLKYILESFVMIFYKKKCYIKAIV